MFTWGQSQSVLASFDLSAALPLRPCAGAPYRWDCGRVGPTEARASEISGLG